MQRAANKVCLQNALRCNRKTDTKKCMRFQMSGSKVVWVLHSRYFQRLLNKISEHGSGEILLHMVNWFAYQIISKYTFNISYFSLLN